MDYSTADGTATQPGDYVPTAGTLSFAPGATSTEGIVTVNGDTLAEPDEVYYVNLSNPVNATLGSPATENVLILNDDAPAGLTQEELTHGGMQWADLGALPGPSPDVDFYRIFQDAYASYQVVVDGASGDLSAPGSPLVLERVAADGTTVLQSAVDAGGSGSRSLSWQRVSGIPEPNELIRVRSGGCTTSCDAADVYRIRSWETTGFIPRFNNSATQVTVLVIHNDGSTPVDGRVWYRNASGAPFADEFFFGLAPLATLVFNTSQAAPGASGSITVEHSGSYGQLTGKAVAVEPATGFTFDTELVSRPR